MSTLIPVIVGSIPRGERKWEHRSPMDFEPEESTVIGRDTSSVREEEKPEPQDIGRAKKSAARYALDCIAELEKSFPGILEGTTVDRLKANGEVVRAGNKLQLLRDVLHLSYDIDMGNIVSEYQRQKGTEKSDRGIKVDLESSDAAAKKHLDSVITNSMGKPYMTSLSGLFDDVFYAPAVAERCKANLEEVLKGIEEGKEGGIKSNDTRFVLDHISDVRAMGRTVEKEGATIESKTNGWYSLKNISDITGKKEKEYTLTATDALLIARCFQESFYSLREEGQRGLLTFGRILDDIDPYEEAARQAAGSEVIDGVKKWLEGVLIDYIPRKEVERDYVTKAAAAAEIGRVEAKYDAEIAGLKGRMKRLEEKQRETEDAYRGLAVAHAVGLALAQKSGEETAKACDARFAALEEALKEKANAHPHPYAPDTLVGRVDGLERNVEEIGKRMARTETTLEGKAPAAHDNKGIYTTIEHGYGTDRPAEEPTRRSVTSPTPSEVVDEERAGSETVTPRPAIDRRETTVTTTTAPASVWGSNPKNDRKVYIEVPPESNNIQSREEKNMTIADDVKAQQDALINYINSLKGVEAELRGKVHTAIKNAQTGTRRLTPGVLPRYDKINDVAFSGPALRGELETLIDGAYNPYTNPLHPMAGAMDQAAAQANYFNDMLLRDLIFGHRENAKSALVGEDSQFMDKIEGFGEKTQNALSNRLLVMGGQAVVNSAANDLAALKQYLTTNYAGISAGSLALATDKAHLKQAFALDIAKLMGQPVKAKDIEKSIIDSVYH